MLELQKTEPTARHYLFTIPQKEVSTAISAEQKKPHKSHDEMLNAAIYGLVHQRIAEVQQQDGCTVLNVQDLSIVPEEEAQTSPDMPAEEKPLKIKVVLECLPDIDISSIEGRAFSPLVFTPSDAEIEEFASEQLKQQAGEFTPQTAATKDSIIKCSVTCKVDGRILPSHTRSQAVIDMRKEDFWPEILKALLGKKAGESVSAEVTMPLSSSPLISNKPASIAVHITEIKKFQEAKAADDASAKKAGFESWKDFLEKFRTNITQTGTKTAQEFSHTELVNIILELDYPTPTSLLQERVAQQRKTALDAIQPRTKFTEDELRLISEKAEREARIVTFVLSYARTHNVNVLPQDVQAIYTPKSPEEAEFYQGIVLEQKVFASIQSKLTSSEKKISLNELKNLVKAREENV